MRNVSNDPLGQIEILEEIKSGKTKRIRKTSNPKYVAFESKGMDITASGAGTEENAGKVQNELVQNSIMFGLLNGLGFATSYAGTKGNHLIHKMGMPFNQEVVVCFGVCARATLVSRYPWLYGEKDGQGNHSQVQPSTKYVGLDKKVHPFKEPVIQLFHKKCVIVKPDGELDLVSESSVKNDPRYFDGATKEPTKFTYDDPLLMQSRDDANVWELHDRLRRQDISKPICYIDRKDGILFKMRDGGGRQMIGTSRLAPADYMSPEQERAARLMVLRALTAIKIACSKTKFPKTRMVGGKAEVIPGEFYDGALVIDGKLELMLDDDGNILITDDLLNTNMRWAFEGKSNMTAKGLYQNADKKDQNNLVALTIAEGIKGWNNPEFIAEVKRELEKVFPVDKVAKFPGVAQPYEKQRS
ncbi:MAG: hypothetical protein FWD15_00405 [Alphaproteobacteria bacterium]|nr:hypothetical protein [Alphaproteobacteria bacterium]